MKDNDKIIYLENSIDNLREDILDIKNILKKSNKKIKIFFLILFLITIAGSVIYLSNLDEYISPNFYEYTIDVYRLERIRDLEVYHYFSEGRGNITFKTEKEDYLEKDATFNIKLPAIIDNKTIKIYKIEENEEAVLIGNWRTIKNPVNMEKYTHILIEDIPPPKYEKNIYFISYEMEILPSGHFSWMHNVELSGFDPIIKFYLGKDYQCYKSCIERRYYVIDKFPTTDKEISMELEDEKSDFHSFFLTGIKDIRVEQGIALGLLVSSIMSFFLILKELVEDSQIKNR